MAERLILHIGTHKTGTSTIQRFLHTQSQALSDQGNSVLYAKTGRDSPTKNSLITDHRRLAWSIIHGGRRATEEATKDRLWRSLGIEISESKAGCAVVSSEEFCVASESEVDEISRQLRDFDVRVILYLRNYLSFARSNYSQCIKQGTESRSFRDYALELSDEYRYADIADRWSARFGRDKLVIRIYEAVRHDLLNDFLTTAELAAPVGCEPMKAWNVSPSEGAVTLIRLLNRASGHLGGSSQPFLRKVRREFQLQRGPGRLAGLLADQLFRQELVSPEDIKLLRESVAESMTRFLDNYVRSEDQHHFEF